MAPNFTYSLTFSQFFPYPNRLQEAVQASGGVWGPLRPSCAPDVTTQLAGGLSCGNGGLENHLAASCDGLINVGDVLASVSGTGGTQITDASGRLICDPRCRSRRTQIDDYVTSALWWPKAAQVANDNVRVD